VYMPNFIARFSAFLLQITVLLFLPVPACYKPTKCNLPVCTSSSNYWCEYCEEEYIRLKPGYNVYSGKPDNKKCQSKLNCIYTPRFCVVLLDNFQYILLGYVIICYTHLYIKLLAPICTTCLEIPIHLFIGR
jgi:hypothetical protein